ncbi:flagellar biosynthetic protein FliO [Coralloluteibacterium thermophilus]|uniref:Flagellar biosynthetic protein FliO n=1 Tax=Coralloluteibacterium thermophilum TaxID=2707049 RepID=A0ABV9NNK1_9GAMM
MRTLPLTLSVLGALWTSAAVAAPAPAPGPSFVGELVSILLPLSLIIAALIAFLLLARRRFKITGRDAPLSVLQVVPVGPRERVVLLQTRRGGVIAVGVSAHRVDLLARLEAEELGLPPPAAAATNSTPTSRPG